MSYRWLSLPVWAGVVALAACGASSQEVTGPRTASEIPDGAAAVAYQVVEEVTTPISGIEERTRRVIGDEEAWSEFWDEFMGLVQPRPDPPAIDFSTHMVIAATMGKRNTGGYTISVEQVAEKDGTLYAAVREVTPGVLCVTTDALTAPAVAVTVPRNSGTVAFVDTELELPCGP